MILDDAQTVLFNIAKQNNVNDFSLYEKLSKNAFLKSKNYSEENIIHLIFNIMIIMLMMIHQAMVIALLIIMELKSQYFK